MPSGKCEDRYPLAAGLGYPLHLTQRHVDHSAAFSPENGLLFVTAMLLSFRINDWVMQTFAWDY